jgi:endonuclease G
MDILERRLSRLRNFTEWVKSGDPQLAEEAADMARTEVLEFAASPEALENAVQEESIVLRRTRPVFAIKENVTQLVFMDESDSAIWRERLTDARELLDTAIRAVGRINLKGSEFEWIGTGWLIAANIIVTNRHVARAFAMREGEGFTFRMGASGEIGADVDFLQEIDNPATLAFRMIKPMHIEEPPGPDIAFFEVEPVGGDVKLASPLMLADKPAKTQSAAVIGYPAYDSRVPEPELMERIFGKIYNKKRLAPGAVTAVDSTQILHNCTTLGGNSGSVIVDLNSGQALGVHFCGTFLTTNQAVRADVLRDLLCRVRAGHAKRPAAPGIKPVTSATPRTPDAILKRYACRGSLATCFRPLAGARCVR